MILNMGGKSLTIKSIQRGTVVFPNETTEVTVTIEPVNPNKTILNHTGFMTSFNATGGHAGAWNGYIQLVDETTIKGKRYSGDNNNDITIAYEVIEFY